MTTTVILLWIMAAVASGQNDCGQTPVPPDETRIVGGQKAVPYSWPWQVEMCFTTRSSGTGPCDLRCGGSIINQYWVMSAAHCVEGFTNSPQRFKLKMGVYDYRSNSERGEIIASVSRIVIHPKFNNPMDMAHDMALLRLKTPITYTDHIQPVCLPSSMDDVLIGGVNLTVTGWGATSDGGSVSPQLRQVTVPSLTPTQCEKQYRHQIDHQTMFCAGRSGKDSCQGDSGGPIVLKRSDGRWWQVGVVSWGEGCAQPGYSGVYAKVSSMCDFIAANIGTNLCQDDNLFKEINPNSTTL